MTTLKTTVCLGVVCVEVPVKDGEGKARTIIFKRCCMGGNVLGSGALYHWTAKPYIKQARAAAVKALKAFVASKKVNGTQGLCPVEA